MDIVGAEGSVAAIGTSAPDPKAAADKARRALSKFEVEQLARIEVSEPRAYEERVRASPNSLFFATNSSPDDAATFPKFDTAVISHARA
jgi:hypothetical protein